MGHLCVVADPRHVEEEPAIQFACIHHPLGRAERHGQSGLRLRWNAEVARQAISGPGRHDAQHDAAVDQRGSHLVDGAVAAPRDHKVGAIPYRLPRQIVRVPWPLRHAYDRVCADIANQAPNPGLDLLQATPAVGRAGGRVVVAGGVHQRRTGERSTVWSNPSE